MKQNKQYNIPNCIVGGGLYNPKTLQLTKYLKKGDKYSLFFMFSKLIISIVGGGSGHFKTCSFPNISNRLEVL